MIEVKDLHKTFKQQEVLKGISFYYKKEKLFQLLDLQDQENQLYLDV